MTPVSGLCSLRSMARQVSEATIVKRGMDVARGLGWWVMKNHGSAYSLAGLPDVLCIKDGRAAWIEFKQPGKEPTKIQWHRMRELIAAGCPCTVAYSAGDVKAFLENLG